MPTTRAPVREGDVLAGKYRVERVLGAGGMGVVVAARHLQLDERVAIKFLLPEALENQELVARFAREARAAVRIRSEHVARVHDVGALEDGAPYMVMEYLHGRDLADRLRSGGPLPVADAVEHVLQAAEAVADAHALGIVHRDLKPANLFLTRRTDGTTSVKVLDFGISKVSPGGAIGGSDAAMTRTTAVMGSPLYMCPEQMTSARSVDARADIWALGVVLHELLAGKPPFVADTMPELCGKVLQEPAPPLRRFRPDVPPGLEAAVLRCLEKDPAKRFPNVAELAVALAPFGPPRARHSAERISRVIQAAGLSASALALPPSTEPAPVAHAGTGVAWAETHVDAVAAKRKGRIVAAVATAAAVGLAGAAVVVARAIRQGDAAVSPPPAAASAQAAPASAQAAPPSAQAAPASAQAAPEPPAVPTGSPSGAAPATATAPGSAGPAKAAVASAADAGASPGRRPAPTPVLSRRPRSDSTGKPAVDAWEGRK